jgi:hypothetical protein
MRMSIKNVGATMTLARLKQLRAVRPRARSFQRLAAAPLAASLVAVWVLAYAQPLYAAGSSCDGVSLPARERAFGMDLVLNGMGIRRVTIFNIHVYVAGLYLERRTKSANEVLQRDRAKAMSMTFVRDADRARMVETMREAIAKQPAPLRDAALKHMDGFQRMLPLEARKGGRLTLAYRPGHGLEVRHNGKVTGVWKDDTFAEVMFRIWLGADPADSGLKAGLLGGECD